MYGTTRERDEQTFLMRPVDVITVVVSQRDDIPSGGTEYHRARERAIGEANAKGYKLLTGCLAYEEDRLSVGGSDVLLPFGRVARHYSFLCVDQQAGRKNGR